MEAYKLPVMKAMCKTCPFKLNGEGRRQDHALADTVTNRTLFKAHQICHGTEGPNREWTRRCKGSFDNNMEIYSRIGCAHLVK